MKTDAIIYSGTVSLENIGKLHPIDARFQRHFLIESMT